MSGPRAAGSFKELATGHVPYNKRLLQQPMTIWVSHLATLRRLFGGVAANRTYASR